MSNCIMSSMITSMQFGMLWKVTCHCLNNSICCTWYCAMIEHAHASESGNFIHHLCKSFVPSRSPISTPVSKLGFSSSFPTISTNLTHSKSIRSCKNIQFKTYKRAAFDDRLSSISISKYNRMRKLTLTLLNNNQVSNARQHWRVYFHRLSSKNESE